MTEVALAGAASVFTGSDDLATIDEIEEVSGIDGTWGIGWVIDGNG